jgi:pilus assembly protein Flp/PilA
MYHRYHATPNALSACLDSLRWDNVIISHPTPESTYNAPGEHERNDEAKTRQRREKGSKKPMVQRRGSRGQGMLEYALIIMLVAMVVIVALWQFGPAISNIFAAASNAI